jgi:hypothetical protein
MDASALVAMVALGRHAHTVGCNGERRE